MDKILKTRRQFLKIMATGTCGALVHNVFEPLSGTFAYALPATQGALGPNSVMLVINLAGGCSYNIAPALHGAYRDKFPTITPAATLAISPDQALHPSLTSFKQTFDEGDLAVINMAGLQGNPDFGHDTASAKWQTGYTSGTMAQGGWMARMTCQLGQAFSGISLSGNDLMTRGDCNPPLSLGDLQNFGEDSFWYGGGYGTEWLRTTRSHVLHDSGAAITETERKIAGSITNLESSLDVLQSFANTPLPVTFPNTSFGNACRDAARLINAGPLHTRVIYITVGGFDTHSNELASHTARFNEINAGIAALTASLKAWGRWNDFVGVTMSEFGRTYQNSNGGTDHGYASPMFLFGGQVRGGIHTPPPVPADLTGSYIRNSHVDPREIYREIVFRMGFDAAQVFPESFAPRGVAPLIFKA